MLAFWIGANFCQINRVEPNLYYKKFDNAKMCPRFGTTNILVGFQTKQAHCILVKEKRFYSNTPADEMIRYNTVLVDLGSKRIYVVQTCYDLARPVSAQNRVWIYPSIHPSRIHETTTAAVAN